MVTDVLVVGGGPAGLAAAIAARAKGMHVVVADPAAPPVDKACGEGLLPDGLMALERMGIRLDEECGHRLRGIRFLGDGVSVEAAFPEGTGLGVRRTLLHRLMVDRAEAAGVELQWGARVAGLGDGTAEVGGRTVRWGWLAGADGQRSRVREWAGLGAMRHESKRYGFRRHYRVAPWTDCVEVHWGTGCQMYVTPVAAQEVGVALLSRDPHLRLEKALVGFPVLTARLRGAEACSAERGAVSAMRRLRRVARGRVALIGDASGSVDAITGEGLCLAFQQAFALADAWAAKDLRGYERAHRRIARRAAVMARALLLLDRFAWLRRGVLRGFAARRGVFGALLGAHVGAVLR